MWRLPRRRRKPAAPRPWQIDLRTLWMWTAMFAFTIAVALRLSLPRRGNELVVSVVLLTVWLSAIPLVMCLAVAADPLHRVPKR